MKNRFRTRDELLSRTQRAIPGIIPAVVVVLMFTACGGGSPSPTSPGPPNSPAAPNSPAPPVSSGRTEWLVTQRFVSVDGPDNCWVTGQRARLTGLVFPNLPMSVTRPSDGSITVQGEFFAVNYGGTMSGTEFSANGAGQLQGGGSTCQGASYQQRPGTSTLSGRFSADDQELTASEVNSYLLTSGEAVVYTWEWRATRRN